MPKPYPKEFRDDVVAVARRREGGVTLAQVAKDERDYEAADVCCEAPSQAIGRSLQ